MVWFLLALIAHALNAVVFVIDKGLLATSGVISQPARYAAYSGLVAAGAVVVLPFAYRPPNAFVLWWSLAAGICWVLALWLFFVGLKYGEASRAVPITGSAVPLFTLILAVTFLGERLAASQIIGVVGLIIGGALLSIPLSGTRGLLGWPLMAAIGGGAAFAAYFAIVDFVYDRFDPFLAAFAYTRLGVGVAALGLFICVRVFGKESKQLQRKSRRKKLAQAAWVVPVAFILSKGIGTLALILQNWAIDLGSVTVVNALQGTQYIVLLSLAALVSVKFPRLFREELRRIALVQKIGGIMLIALGLIFVV